MCIMLTKDRVPGGALHKVNTTASVLQNPAPASGIQ